jgi:hypothetical protein
MIFQQWEQMGRIYSDQEQAIVPVMYPDFILDNFYVEVDVLPQSTELDYTFGLILRSDDMTDNYHAVALYPEKSELQFRTWQGSKGWISTDKALIPGGLLRVGEIVTLRVEVVEDSIRVFIDGQYIQTFQGSLGKGIVGFFVSPSSNREIPIESAEILFDDFIVYNTRQCNAFAP